MAVNIGFDVTGIEAALAGIEDAAEEVFRRTLIYFGRSLRGRLATQYKRLLKNAIRDTGAVDTGQLRRGVKVQGRRSPRGPLQFDLLPFFPKKRGVQYGFIVSALQARRGDVGFIPMARMMMHTDRKVRQVVQDAFDTAFRRAVREVKGAR